MVTLVAAILTILVLGIGGAMTKIDSWYQGLIKPAWNPPNWAFAPAWTIILGLTAWSGVLAWTHAPDAAGHIRLATLFGVNIVLHLLWSPLFFSLRRPDWALIEMPFLWLSILAIIMGVAPFSTMASWLVLPYLIWVSFAAVLNLTIVRINPPFAPRPGDRRRVEPI